MTNLSEVRKRAWKTRRQKYGDHGHAGAYTRNHYEQARMRTMERALVTLHVDEVLTEGQAAKMTGLDRIAVRTIADEIIMERENA